MGDECLGATPGSREERSQGQQTSGDGLPSARVDSKLCEAFVTKSLLKDMDVVLAAVGVVYRSSGLDSPSSRGRGPQESCAEFSLSVRQIVLEAVTSCRSPGYPYSKASCCLQMDREVVLAAVAGGDGMKLKNVPEQKGRNPNPCPARPECTAAFTHSLCARTLLLLIRVGCWR